MELVETPTLGIKMASGTLRIPEFEINYSEVVNITFGQTEILNINVMFEPVTLVFNNNKSPKDLDSMGSSLFTFNKDSINLRNLPVTFQGSYNITGSQTSISGNFFSQFAVVEILNNTINTSSFPESITTTDLTRLNVIPARRIDIGSDRIVPRLPRRNFEEPLVLDDVQLVQPNNEPTLQDFDPSVHTLSSGSLTIFDETVGLDDITMSIQNLNMTFQNDILTSTPVPEPAIITPLFALSSLLACRRLRLT